jgi:hypothetical protein
MTLDTAQREEVFALAKKTVRGVAAARIGNSETDAAYVISTYHQEAHLLGANPSTAWALLFSASMVTLTDVLAEIAAEHHQSPAAELADLALHQELT